MEPSLALRDWLRATLIFRELTSSQLQALADIAQPQVLAKKAVIFEEGSEATGFFVVKTGRVKIYKISPNGKEQILQFFGEREYFAEVPAMDGQCFPVSAATLEASELLFFPRPDFLSLLGDHPEIAVGLLVSFSIHLRQLTKTIEDLAFKDVPQRLATYLLDQYARLPQSDTLTLDLTKSQLAAALGTIPATLSRAFYRLSQEELIVVNGPDIEVINPDGLQSFAQATQPSSDGGEG